MPKIIVKCGCLKGASHRSFYAKYMATREGTEKISHSYGKAEATAKQKDMIQSILKDFQDARELFEYEDYLENPTRENASELISAVMEHHLEQMATKENYVNYIAKRPRAERLGEHGLFSDRDDPIHLNKTAEETALHEGPVWTMIISLKREDAVRLGYDHANAWKNLCRAKRNELADALKIDPSDLNWYAAFHNEGHHPHIHMIAYSRNPSQGYLTQKGIEKVRRAFAGTIFKEDHLHLYQEQTEKRNRIKKISREKIQELLASLNSPIQEQEEMNQLVRKLQTQLAHHQGRKVYAYLNLEAKKLVDELVTLLEKDERIQELYDGWYQKKDQIRQTYQESLSIRLPLHVQKEFKSIKNMILHEVSHCQHIDESEIEHENERLAFRNADHLDSTASYESEAFQRENLRSGSYVMEWNTRYKEAILKLYRSKEPSGMEEAIWTLCLEAERMNVLALSELGKIYQRGIFVEKDEAKSKEYYEQAFDGFYALYKYSAKKTYPAYRIGKCYLYGLGVSQDYEKAKEYLKEAGEHQYSLYLLGMMAKRGLGEEADERKAFLYFIQSADMGNAYAQFETASAYENGKGNEKNQQEAQRYYDLAFKNFVKMEAENSDDHLQYRLGKMCYEGKGTDPDLSLAIRYLQSSAEKKNEDAMFLLAKIWLKENYYDHIEEAKAILEELVEKENEFAYMLLGKEYLSGEHWEKNVQKGIESLEKCAEKGNSYADYLLYRVYLHQESQKTEKMLTHLQRSAERGNAFAQAQLGKTLLDGTYIQKDVSSAISWLKKSADQNNAFAQYLLGKLFLLGKEVEKDEALALHYLSDAASQGNEYAQWLLDHRKEAEQLPFILAVSRFFHHISRIFEQQMVPDRNHPLYGVDRKLRRKIQEKREALGHKRKDPTINLGS